MVYRVVSEYLWIVVDYLSQKIYGYKNSSCLTTNSLLTTNICRDKASEFF